MNQPPKKKTLVEVKLELASKYESLARQSGSKPRQKRFLLRAERYRGQARQLECATKR
ncbi:MAG TPA: hypothetical protein VF306_18040 [Pirellulales bacterium]